MEGGKPVADSFGNKVFSDKYKQYLTTRQRPADAEAFKAHLRGVLSRLEGDPALLCISRYTGDAWWGLTYIEFFYDPVQQLSRLSPSQGVLYIALNSDRMKPGEKSWNDPAFWASKIGHESLHSLGYNHPGYKDAADRDKNNPPGKRAFIVAYEFALLQQSRKQGK